MGSGAMQDTNLDEDDLSYGEKKRSRGHRRGTHHTDTVSTVQASDAKHRDEQRYARGKCKARVEHSGSAKHEAS